MFGLVADTHALLWFLSGSPFLPQTARDRMQATIEGGDLIFVPTICLVEVIYLVERGRLPATALDRIYTYLDQPDSGVELVPLDRGVAEALSRVPRDLVPDMPDRIIAATALHLGLPLVSRDGDIRTSGIELVW